MQGLKLIKSKLLAGALSATCVAVLAYALEAWAEGEDRTQTGQRHDSVTQSGEDAEDSVDKAQLARIEKRRQEVRKTKKARRIYQDQSWSEYLTKFDYTWAVQLVPGGRDIAKAQVEESLKIMVSSLSTNIKGVEFGGVNIFRMADGKIVEDWVYRDTVGMLRQLGAMPPPPGQAGR